jgi:protein phosphatase
LTRALGIDAIIDPDCWEIDLEPTSRLLLCSDGLTNELAEQEIAEVLAQEPDTGKAAAELVRRALARGGTDNVTVVVVDVLAGQSPAALEDVVMIPEGVAGTSARMPVAAAPEITEAIVAMPVGSVLASGEDGADGAPAGADGTSPEAPTTSPLGTPAIAPGTAGTRARPILLVRSKRPKGNRDRIVTVRVVLFVLVFVAVLGGTAGVVVWFDKASFFVGLDRGHVTIFQGRPGGLLWFKPSVVERTSLTPADLLASNVVALNQGMEASSYQAARNLVHGLSLERVKLGVTTTSTTTVRKRAATARGPTTTTRPTR